MTTPLILQSDFNEITQLIHAARQRVVQAVNTVLIAIQGQHRNSFEGNRGRATV